MKRLDSFAGKIDEPVVAVSEGLSGEISGERKASGEVIESIPEKTKEEIRAERITENKEKLKEYGVIIRPYLQDFTASWLGKGNYLTYGTAEVKAQIQAGYDLGIEDFCLWDPSNKYCYDALPKIEN